MVSVFFFILDITKICMTFRRKRLKSVFCSSRESANTMGFVEALVEAEVPLERSDQSVPCFFLRGTLPKTNMEPENDGF